MREALLEVRDRASSAVAAACMIVLLEFSVEFRAMVENSREAPGWRTCRLQDVLRGMAGGGKCALPGAAR